MKRTKRIAYRGISLQEAEAVVKKQFYERNERRDFHNGIQARSTFGPGLYLVNDVELAAQYAYCNTEVEGGEEAAVLKQWIYIDKPYIINYHSTEKKLKRKALEWKLEFERCSQPSEEASFDKGEVVREYLLHHGYDGIIYHINDELIYYVCYFQERQVEDITIDFTFHINDLKKMSAVTLRDNYKKKMRQI